MTGKLQDVPLALIDAPPAPVAMQKTLVALGQLEPVTLHQNGDGRYSVINGRRRISAALAAGQDAIQAVVKTGLDTPTRHLHALAHNAGTPNRMDEAEHIEALLEAGYTLKTIAATCNIPPGTLRSRIRLLSLVVPLREAVRKGDISPTAGSKLAALPPKQQAALAGQKVTVKDATLAVNKWRSKQLAVLPAFDLDIEMSPPGLFINGEAAKALAAGQVVEVEYGGRRLQITVAK